MAKRKKRVITLIIILAVALSAVIAVYGAFRNNSLPARYPGMEWEEKAQLYGKYLLKTDILPEYYVDLKIITELPLKTRLSLQNRAEKPKLRLLFSYDYRRNHYLVYANAEWRSDKIMIEPLHTDVKESPAQALISYTGDWAQGGEEVYYGEVFDPGIVAIKVYILAESDPQPVYISRRCDLQNGGFMIEEPLANIWLIDANNELHEVM